MCKPSELLYLNNIELGGEPVDFATHFMVDSTDFGDVIETTCGNEAVTVPKLADEGSSNQDNNT